MPQIVNTSLRILPRPRDTQGARYILGAAETLGRGIEQRRQEQRQEEAVTEERGFQREMADQAFERQRTLGREQFERQKELAEMDHDLRRALSGDELALRRWIAKQQAMQFREEIGFRGREGTADRALRREEMGLRYPTGPVGPSVKERLDILGYVTGGEPYAPDDPNFRHRERYEELLSLLFPEPAQPLPPEPGLAPAPFGVRAPEMPGPGPETPQLGVVESRAEGPALGATPDTSTFETFDLPPETIAEDMLAANPSEQELEAWIARLPADQRDAVRAEIEKRRGR